MLTRNVSQLFSFSHDASKLVSIDWLFTVLRPAQEFFTYMETSPLPVSIEINIKNVYQKFTTMVCYHCKVLMNSCDKEICFQQSCQQFQAFFFSDWSYLESLLLYSFVSQGLLFNAFHGKQ
jgi:hypothetical protein